MDDDVARGAAADRADARAGAGTVPPGPLRRGARARGAGDRAGRRPGRPRRPRARVLPQPRHPHAARQTPSAMRSAGSRCRSSRRSATSSARPACSTTSGSRRTTRAAGTRRATSTSAAGSLRERIGDVINVATTTNNVGEIELRPGPLRRRRGALPRGAAHRRLRRSSADLRRRRAGTSAASPRASGRYTDADELLTGALATLDAIGSGPFLLEFQARRAEL